MKFLSALLILIVSITPFVACPKTDLDTVILTPENSTSIVTQVDSGSVQRVIDEIVILDRDLDKDAVIYLVLDTPGGSIIAGNKLIRYIKSIDREVKTITIMSVSMGFQISQSLGERLVVSDGFYMSHNGSTRCEGNVMQIESCLTILKGLDTQLNSVSAKRMGITLEAYEKLIANEAYFFGSDRFHFNVADRVVNIKCSQELIDKRVETVTQNFIFSSTTEKSACPLI